jgi:hypothetical protein
LNIKSFFKIVFFARDYWEKQKLEKPVWDEDGFEHKKYVVASEPSQEWREEDCPCNMQKILCLGLIYCPSQVSM